MIDDHPAARRLDAGGLSQGGGRGRNAVLEIGAGSDVDSQHGLVVSEARHQAGVAATGAVGDHHEDAVASGLPSWSPISVAASTYPMAPVMDAPPTGIG